NYNTYRISYQFNTNSKLKEEIINLKNKKNPKINNEYSHRNYMSNSNIYNQTNISQNIFEEKKEKEKDHIRKYNSMTNFNKTYLRKKPNLFVLDKSQMNNKINYNIPRRMEQKMNIESKKHSLYEFKYTNGKTRITYYKRNASTPIS
ncbi:MAG: hypothetical protein MJ252_17100, partial [archaeon]|nr:hypothetical protein [archaeon]